MVINLLFTFCRLTQMDFFTGRLAESMGNIVFLASSCSVAVEWSDYWALNKRKRKMNERSSWYILSLLEYLESLRSVKLHYISLYARFHPLRMCYLTGPDSRRMKWLGYTSMRSIVRHRHPSRIIYTISVFSNQSACPIYIHSDLLPTGSRHEET